MIAETMQVVPGLVGGHIVCFESSTILAMTQARACNFLPEPMEDGVAGEVVFNGNDRPIIDLRTRFGLPQVDFGRTQCSRRRDHAGRIRIPR